MTNKQCERRLAQALGALRPKTNVSAVAGAMSAPAAATPVSVSHPHRYRRYVAAVAATAVMMVGVGTWWNTRPEETPPIAPSVDNPVDVPADPTAITSLAEAKTAIAQGRYEAAYLYLLTDTSEEAVALLAGFSYVPVGGTGGSNWEIDENGKLLSQPVIPDTSGFDSEGLVDGSVDWDSAGKATREEYTYDEKDRVQTIAMVYVNGDEESREIYAYVYDAADNIVKREFTDINGKKKTWVYTYDEKGRCIKEESGGDGYVDVTITYAYDEADRLLLRYETFDGSDSWHKTEYTYDAKGNLLKNAYLTSDGGGWTYEYTYDAEGNQTSYSHTLPDSPDHWQKWYMEGDKKISESLSQGYIYEKSISVDDKCIYWYFRRGNDVTETDFTYDEQGNRLTELTWFGNSNGEYIVYTYDDRNNLLQKAVYTITDRDRPEATATLYEVKDTYTYVYDADGRILQQEHTDGGGYVTKTEYTYDAAGRLLTHKNTYNNDTWDSITHTYHDNGNVKSTEKINADGTWKKETFDAAGNRLSMEDSEGKKTTYEWTLCYYAQNLTEQQRNDLEQLRLNAKYLTGDSMGFE